MIQCQEIPETNVLEFTIDGNITEEEFDDLVGIMNQIIEEYGDIRVLKVIRSLGDFPTIPVSRIWDDLKFGFEHFRDVSRAAIVSDHQWIEKMTNMMNPLFKAEIKHFSEDEIDAARKWLLNNE